MEEYIAVARIFVLDYCSCPHLRYGNFGQYIVFVNAFGVYLLLADFCLYDLAIHDIIGCCLEGLNGLFSIFLIHIVYIRNTDVGIVFPFVLQNLDTFLDMIVYQIVV